MTKILWFRVVLLSAPFALLAAGAWVFAQARHFQFERSEDLIYVIQSPPGEINPFVPNTGVTREITDLVFERLFRRDDDLNLRPHLAASWTDRQRVTLRMANEEAATKALDFLETAGEDDAVKAVGLLETQSDGPIIQAWLEGHDRSKIDGFVNLFKEEEKAELLHVRLSVRDSIEQSLDLFLEGSIEREKIKLMHYRSGREADLFIGDETDLFLKELRLYYESNRNLEPLIEVLGKSNFYTDMDMSLTLRDDLAWQDGEPIVADDVIFSFEELTRPGSIYPLKDEFWFVDRVEKISDLEIRILCTESCGVMLEAWEKLPILPSHRLSPNTTDESWRAFFEKPIGSGPYALLERRDDGSVMLGAHTKYFRGAPRQERVIYRQIPDREERLLAVRLGKIDVIEPDAREILWMERQQDDVRFLKDVARYQTFIAWNLRDEKFSDPEVRRGLRQALDLENIVAECSAQKAQLCRGLYFPGSPYAKNSNATPAFDLEKAKEKLKDAKPFTLSYDAGNFLNQRLATEFQRAWRKAGVEVKLEPMAWADLLGIFPAAEFDAVILGWELEVGRDQRRVWHSRYAEPGGSNFCGLENEEVDALLEKIILATDPDKAKELTGNLQDKIAELQPALFICETGRELAVRRNALEMVRPRISGDGEMKAEPLMVGRTGFSSVRPWWVRKAELKEVKAE